MRIERLVTPVSLIASLAVLAAVTRRVRRDDTRRFDEACTTRLGTGEGGLARMCQVAEPRFVALEATTLALLPGWRATERAALLLAPAISGAVGAALKRFIHRERPLKHRFQPGGDESFPSTHAAYATSLALTVASHLVRRGRSAWCFAPAIAIAGAVGVGRIRGAAHWPTDVVAGVAIGVAAASASAHLVPSDSRS